MFILKQLRRKKNINQTDLANAIGVSLRTIQLYEKKGANIPIKNLTKIAQYFDVSIAELYSHESVNELGAVYSSQGNKFRKGHTIAKLAPGKYLVTTPLVTVEQYGRYLEQYPDPNYIQSLHYIGFTIDHVSVGHYMSFEISNDSMDNGTINRVPKEAIVLVKLVSGNKVGTMLKNKPDTNWIIVHKNGIMCKRITFSDRTKKVLTCQSLNNSPEYPDFEINIDDVKQFYKILKKQV